MSARQIRGQATTELALGSLVFVTVLLFGIYFGEVPVMMLKVKEAANFAMTHATGSRTHMFNAERIVAATPYEPFDPTKVGVDTQKRYRDFDGMSDRSGGTFTQAMTSGTRLQVDCEADNRIWLAVARPAGLPSERGAAGQTAYNDTFAYLSNRYRNRGGVACVVSARATPFRLPTHFLDTGAGKMSEEKLKQRTMMSICGAGRPTGNVCRGELMVLTGDWSFDAPLGTRPNEDVESVQDDQRDNDPYAVFVEQLYEKNGNSQNEAGRKLLRVVAGVKSGEKEYLDESLFNMSFRGDRGGKDEVVVERVVVDPLPSKPLQYQTSGADMRSDYVGWNEKTGVAKGIPPCFLGLAGCER